MFKNILIDTSIMLHDFYFRNQNPATQATNPIAIKIQKALHECLELLSKNPEAVLYIPQHCLYRLLSVLSDLQISQSQIRQEMLYWMDNAGILNSNIELLEDCLQNPTHKEIEDNLLILLATQNQISTIFSIKPRFDNADEVVRFVWPEKMLLELNKAIEQ